MKNRIFILIALAMSMATSGQKNFSYQPLHPRPGDVITITYSPAGDLANTAKPVEAKFYLFTRSGTKADDLPLKYTGKNYSGTIQTDTSVNFVQLGFYADETYDNNFNEGYTIPLWKGDTICKESYLSLAQFYDGQCRRTGGEINQEKALSVLENQRTLYPGLNEENEGLYFYLLSEVKKDQLQGIVLKEIESTMKKGLKTEDDYGRMKYLYRAAKLPFQSAFIDSLRREKFPNGKWKMQSTIDQIYSELNTDKRIREIISVMDKIGFDPGWKEYTQMKEYFQGRIIQEYANEKNWDKLKQYEGKPESQISLASAYNDLAWKMQEKNEDLKKAEEISDWATQNAKKEINEPSVQKTDNMNPIDYYLTPKESKKQRESTYAMYADTYAMVEYKLGKYSKGFPFTDEAALGINRGNDADQNNTWALLASKVLSPEKYKPRLEHFVKDGLATDSVKAILKRVYISEKGSALGYDNYLSSLEKDAKVRMEAETRKSIISREAPVFALKNLQGEEVDLAKLKGKVVVIDFWATWCGPCKASLPGMQKEVNKYKDNPDVQVLFIDTWEQGETAEKLKNVSGFISKNKYDNFNVLMDNDNTVVGKFNVSGIPTKFVVDRNGMIRFKTVGFNNEQNLLNEIDSMIGICLKL